MKDKGCARLRDLENSISNSGPPVKKTERFKVAHETAMAGHLWELTKLTNEYLNIFIGQTFAVMYNFAGHAAGRKTKPKDPKRSTDTHSSI